MMHLSAASFLLFFLLVTTSGIVEIGEHVQEDREGPVFISDETRLHNDLFFRKRDTHPTNKVLDVTFGLTLVSITDYDSAGEVFVINAFIRQTWNNPALSWNPHHYGGIRKINVAPDQTWVPDIHAYGNTEAQFKYNGMLDTLKTYVIVHANGYNFWLAPVIMHLGCGMNVKDFPFDVQVCPLLFGSFTQDKSKLNLIPEKVDMTKYSESSEWTFQSINHTREVILYPGVPIRFSDVKYTVIFKRKPLYYFLHIFLPTIGLSFLTLLVSIQPIGAGERCIYIVILVSALNWLLSSAIIYLPPSGDGVPLTQVFLAASMCVMVCISLLLCYSIAVFYGDSSSNEMPIVLRKYILGTLGKYLGWKLERKYPLWREKLILIRESENRLLCQKKDSKDHLAHVEGMDNFIFQLRSKSKCLRSSKRNLRDTLEQLFGVKGISQLSSRLDIMLNKFEDDDDSEWTQREWKTLSFILDRLFLHLFRGMFGMLLAYCAIYVLYMAQYI